MDHNRHNPNLISATEVAHLLGYKTQLGRAREVLERDGVKVWPGAKGTWFVTLQQLNAARGVSLNNDDGEKRDLI